MADDLLTYYERELSFIRQMAGEFAGKYPKIASRLLLESDKSEDPHVERLVQAFAFLAARGRPRASQNRRRISGNHRVAVKCSLPTLLGADPIHVDRAVRPRSRARKVDDRFSDRQGRDALLASSQRFALSVSHVLSSNAVAHRRGRGAFRHARWHSQRAAICRCSIEARTTLSWRD